MSDIQVCQVQDYAKVSKLKIHPENPREITPERLASLKRSILKKGFYQPILVWNRGNVVLAGNHRLIAARELIAEGYTFVTADGQTNVLPIVLEDCDKAQARSILFESNNTYAEWIEDKLKAALREVDETTVEDWGFSPQDVDTVLKEAVTEGEAALEEMDVEEEVAVIPERIDAVENEDEVPKLAKETVVKEGDVWLLGEHKLLCGDAAMIDNYEKLLGKKKIASCCFTIPPVNKEKEADEYVDFCQQVLSNIFSFTGGFIYWNASYSFNDRTSYFKVIQPFAEELYELVIWERKEATPRKDGLTLLAEPIFVFKHNSKKDHLGKERETNFNIWKISGISAEGESKATPVLLSETAITLATAEGDTVLEPFAISGSTLIACEKLRRKCIAIEASPQNCDRIIRRWMKFTGREACLESTAQTYGELSEN